jgi:cell division protein FtsL
MKIGVVIILMILLLAASVQIYLIFKELNQLKKETGDMGNRLATLSKENTNLQSEIEYFSRPENLEKELKAKFNYKKPGEKMIIITP